MKGGKDEEKRMDPLFPRLHINDAEKGRLRPPPRNKMALCEQLSMPSQRFTPGSMSMSLPLNKKNGSLVPSAPSNHGGSHKRNMLRPFCSTTASTQLVDRFHSYSLGGLNSTTKSTCLQQQRLNTTKNRNLSITGHLTTTAGGLFQPKSISNSNNSNMKKLEVEDTSRVPMFAQLVERPNLGINQQYLDKERPVSSIKGTRQLQTVCEGQLKQMGMTDLKIRPHQKNKIADSTKPSVISVDHAKNTPFLSAGNKILLDASLSLLSRGKISEPISEPHVSSNPVTPQKRSKLADSLNRLLDCNAQEHKVFQENKAPEDCAPTEVEKATRKRIASTLDGVSGSIASLEDNCSRPERLETATECHEDKDSASSQAEEADKNNDVSDTSVVDSISGQNISSDVVVEVLGQKQIWETRKTIVHQQRVFAVQVFELHRLVKVQRLIAKSPDLLLEDNLYIDKPKISESSAKNLAAGNVLELPSLTVKQKVHSQKQSSPNQSSVETAVGKSSLLSLNMDTVEGNLTQLSRAMDAKPIPWCLPPPSANQWLVPVRSPSEGLVYKPYTGSCPPPAGFMAQIFGSCGAMRLNPVGGDFFNTACGAPASHQRQRNEVLSSTTTPSVGHTYSSSYGMSVMNPSGFISSVEHESPFVVRGRSSGSEVQDTSISLPYQSSCNTTSERSVVISGCGVNLESSKQGNLQGSTASSPSDRAPGVALPLFPTVPTTESSQQPTESHSNEQRIQVIKAVPRNPKSALESAARILQSIQEERKQYD